MTTPDNLYAPLCRQLQCLKPRFLLMCAASGASSQAAAQNSALPVGPGSGGAAAHQNVYESQGRPPAIREDQELVGICSMLPKTPQGSDSLARNSYIGRNASFDRCGEQTTLTHASLWGHLGSAST